MEPIKIVPGPVIVCNNCAGVGKTNGKKCLSCKGFGIASFSHGKLFFWKKRISRYSLALNKTRRFFNIFRVVSFLVAGITAWLWAAYYYFINNQGVAASFQNIPQTSKTLFLAGLTIFLYVIYRLNAEQKKITPVEHLDYELEMLNRRNVENWADLLNVKRSLRRNIADSLTAEALLAIDSAFRIADRRGALKIDPAHLFVALLGSVRISNAFIRLGIAPKILIDELVKQDVLKKEGKKNKKPPTTEQDVVKIFFDAYEGAFVLRQHYVSVTDLLIATVAASESVQDVLFDLSVDNQKLKNVIAWARIRENLSRQRHKVTRAGQFRPKNGMDRAMTAVATPFLNRISDDLTLNAQTGRTDVCVARDKEIEEIFQIIEGGQNSVLLVGDYGVGRKTVLEGIAAKMVAGDVPKRLVDKRLVQLRISSLLSGTTPSGAIERLGMVMNEVARARNIILCIHNLQELLGVSAGSDDNSMDVAGTLSEFLASGKFFVFATATSESYAQQISNSKLSTVLTKVEIKEMDVNQSIEALESRVGYIEYKEKVFFSYDSIAKAVEYARRYLRDVPLPGSALEIITEAAVRARGRKGPDALVTIEEVGEVIADKTHIPMTAVSEDEGTKLMQLEQEMHRRVIGQDEAVKLIASALRRARAEIRSQAKPIANFLFLGPTGVGKTELAKTIAEVYFGGENKMIRIDMSEYQDKAGIYRLIGQPGAKGTGILTEAVRHQPFGLLLLDEIEKADKDVLNLFLQVMDDGRLTDSTGRVVDFTNIILIATSNAGTSFVQDQISAGVSSDKIKEKLIHGELRDYFRPEFLNRFDGIVLFEPMTKSAIEKITALMLHRISKDLETKGIRLEATPESIVYFSELGYDPQFGARPLRRVLQEKVENQLAEFLLSGKLKRRDTVVLDGGGMLSIKS